MTDEWETFLAETVRKYSAPVALDSPSAEIEPSQPQPIGTIVLENASCGDRVEVLRIGGGIRVRGKGCAICRASSAIATEIVDRVEGDRNALTGIAETMLAILGSENAESPPDLPEHLLGGEMVRRLQAFSLFSERPARRRCASLAWEALLQWASRVDSR